MRKFYVYAYLAPDGTPVYVGKGSNDRHLEHWKSVRYRLPKKHTAIQAYLRTLVLTNQHPHVVILQTGLTNVEAYAHEVAYIAKYGRIDLGTGTLYNRTKGGDGCRSVVPLWKRTPEGEQRRKEAARAALTTPEHAEVARKAALARESRPGFSEYRNSKVKEALAKQTRKPCPHCSREFKPSTFTRYHGDRCPTRPAVC